mmetsp:Transcript_30746/g.72946  ORF Transcript_30746/g.72946 Transcript_30746/m.72946 type:complete len:221 (-) Transcript_30746:418-1080(-)
MDGHERIRGLLLRTAPRAPRAPARLRHLCCQRRLRLLRLCHLSRMCLRRRRQGGAAGCRRERLHRQRRLHRLRRLRCLRRQRRLRRLRRFELGDDGLGGRVAPPVQEPRHALRRAREAARILHEAEGEEQLDRAVEALRRVDHAHARHQGQRVEPHEEPDIAVVRRARAPATLELASVTERVGRREAIRFKLAGLVRVRHHGGAEGRCQDAGRGLGRRSR